MIKTYSGTQYILRHPNGNGELLERYETVEDAIKGREAAAIREVEYRKENGFSILNPSKYVIVKHTWEKVYEITDDGESIFISSLTRDLVVPEND